jgi:hypothetical protein
MGLTERATVARQYRDQANLNARIALHERFSTNRVGLSRWLFAQMNLQSRARLLEAEPGTVASNLELPVAWCGADCGVECD